MKRVVVIDRKNREREKAERESEEIKKRNSARENIYGEREI